MKDWVRYGKKAAVAVGAALSTLAVVLADGVVTASEWITVAIAAGSALGVFGITNGPKPDGRVRSGGDAAG